MSYTVKKSDEKVETVEEFLARTNAKVVTTKPNNLDSELLGCDCGCDGNYTEHSMRLGEKGIY